MAHRPVSRRYSRRAVLRLGAVSAAGALIAAACGSNAGEGGQPGVSDAPAALQLQSRPRAPQGEPAGVIRTGALEAVDVAGDGFTRETRLLAYSRLVGTDPRDGSVYGDLATSLEVIDPLTVRFSLDRDAHFHPGASDLAQPLDGPAIRRDFARRAAEEDYLFAHVIERVDADGGSITLHLRAPFALLFESLGSPERSVRSDETYKQFDAPLGSGPFMPGDRDGDRIALVRNPLFHQDGYPRLAGATVTRFATDRDWASAFVAGDLDVWVQSGPAVADAPVRADASRAVRPAMRQRGLGLSLLPERGGVTVRHVEAFQDQRVRRAVALALNREALLAADAAVTSGPVGPAHVADALPPGELAEHAIYRRDVAEARALLRASAHEGLSFRLEVPDLEPLRTYGQLMVEQLTAAGFDPRPQVMDVESWQTAFGAGNFEAVVFEIGGLTTPDIGLRLHTAGGVDGRFSLWGYSNPVYDAAVREALSALNPTARAERARAAQRLLLDDVPAMFPIAAPTEAAAIAANVTGYAFPAYDFNAGWLASAWELRESRGS